MRSSSTNASKPGSDLNRIPPGLEANKLDTSKDEESHQNINKISSPSYQQTNLEKVSLEETIINQSSKGIEFSSQTLISKSLYLFNLMV